MFKNDRPGQSNGDVKWECYRGPTADGSGSTRIYNTTR